MASVDDESKLNRVEVEDDKEGEEDDREIIEDVVAVEEGGDDLIIDWVEMRWWG